MCFSVDNAQHVVAKMDAILTGEGVGSKEQLTMSVEPACSQDIGRSRVLARSLPGGAGTGSWWGGGGGGALGPRPALTSQTS